MKCPHLRYAPLIPFKGRKYPYCEIKNGPSDKTMLEEQMLYDYCNNDLENHAYENCPFWQKYYNAKWKGFLDSHSESLKKIKHELDEDES